MSNTASYGTSCKTKEQYKKDGFSIIEESNGTVSVYDSNLQPVTQHETKPCCEALGYTFDIENQKCRWALDNEELFKVVLNPEANNSILFDVQENETCSLEITFDYIFQFDYKDMLSAKAKANNIEPDIQQEIDILEAELNNVTVECNFYEEIIDKADEIPYVIQCLGGGIKGPDGSTLQDTPSLYYGGNLPPGAYGTFDPNTINYCLTDDGLNEWRTIIGEDKYTMWINSHGSDTTMYNCDDVKKLTDKKTPNVTYVTTCDYNIFDRKIARDTITQYSTKFSDCETKKTELEAKIAELNPNDTNTECDEYIEMFENFDTAFTIEVLDESTNRLLSVYEEPLLTIGSGNLYEYINSTSGATGILISGDTGLMPTLKETKLLDTPADLSTQIRDNLVTDLFNQYLLDNDLPQTQQEQIEIFTKLTGWYQSEWLQYKTIITDPSIINLIENKKINITISIKNYCVNFSILLDRIKMYKVCTKVDNVEKYISEPPKFELVKVIDNKKSWIANTDKDYRFFDLKYRGTEYDSNHHKLVINTKEVDLNLSPSRAVEQDVWTYIADNNCILEGCLTTDEGYSSFSCPSGYTLDIDADSCTKTTTATTITSATTYTIGNGVGLSRNIHYLSRGVTFVEDVTNKAWPIYWTGTAKDTWVGPYYNSDYLTDSSGNYLTHSGFGTNNYTDGSLKYSSPEAFSGIYSKFGRNNGDVINNNLNPNILWGGTSAIVSGSTFVNVSGTVNAGRLLNASIWSNPGILPIQEWIGISYCFEANETKTYRIGFAGDDNVRVKINGRYLINPEATPEFNININNNFSTSYSRSIQTYLIVGITLSSGKNIIEVEGYNNASGIGGFVLEIYDATESQLRNIRYESELASVTVFSTIDKIGDTFDLGENSGYSCPAGYALDTCNTSYNCVKIERVTRADEQLDNYCLCSGYPQIVKNYENVTTELPLTASTNTLNCNDITTLANNFNTTTTLEEIEIVKGNVGYALGTKTSNTFDGFWFTEENDNTIGVYEVDWISGSTNTFENLSNQVTSGCCQVISDMFETHSNDYLQSINHYIKLSWDKNKNKCVYSKCGDNGCTNLDDLLTTELSEINTVHEFTNILSSELIDVKNRQTISGYPTLRMLYDRYNIRSEEFCGNTSSKFDYFDMDKFGKTVGNYWIDLIEQVVPATAIWGSTYAYKNTVFDQQKYKYRNSNLYFKDPSSNFPMSAISMDTSVSVKTIDVSEKPLTGNTISVQSSTDNSNGVWIMENASNSEFLGTVKVIDNSGNIIVI